MKPVTLLLVAANVLAYLLELGAGGQAVCGAYGLVPARFVRSGDLGPVFSSMFLHANLTHLVGNLVFLAVFGAIAEIELGGTWLTVLYFMSGVSGALLHVAVDPRASNAMVGCSGCVFGLIALVAARRPRFLGFALAFGVIEIWHALNGSEASVSFGAHLGGLAAGVFFAAIMRLAEKARSFAF